MPATPQVRLTNLTVDYGFREGTMSLSPYERHPSQFKTSELREPPKLSGERVIVATAIALAILAFGIALHLTGQSKPACYTDLNSCPPPAGSSTPLLVWVVVAILVGVLVVAWPWIRLWLTRLIGRVRPDGDQAAS
jgi:hypothetical protein